ncbi:ABC transporter permease [Dermatobacter hominis]|uniref:ABC transporter permease n=1 Tax=Dermatobacter hominis TaxID=2884263 RepID=UPI001D0F8395|nr:ABC transporter permease [Dermatobacter hominis]UDY36447.1 ABC transporter permease [Dermatobacter hominis]
MPATDPVPTRDPSIMNLDPSIEVYGLAVDSDQLEPVPADGRRRRRGMGVAAWIALIWLVGLLLLAIFAPLLPFIPDPNESFAEIARQGPVSGHLLGGDANGRDLLARIIYGTRASFAIGFGAVAFGLVIGGLLGLATGFFRGKVDAIITPIMTILLAIPQFVLALSLVTVLSSGDQVSSVQRIGVVVLGLGIVSIPILGRITRANTLSWSEREFVLAARAMGAKNWRIMLRDILPNVFPAMLSISLLGVGIAIVAEGGLSLFGVGVQPPTPSWGNIISENKDQLNRAPHIVMFTIVVLFLTVLALNYLADVVSKRFEVRESVL